MREPLHTVALIGRILLGSIFVISGWLKLVGFAGTAGLIGSKGLPMPEILAAGSVLIELGGGLALVTGFKARWAALAIALFTVVITPIFHNFWAAPAAQAMIQQINFEKNVAIIGGMLMVIAFGPGRYSFDKG
ncbi:MAG TPA: DoxX family protein [Casimicrobiaceae bacterium]|nr:DoxX family protein [Casimicrobiaceae bacterium]